MRCIEASVWWPRVGEVKVTDLVLERLLPKAYDGLDRFGVDPAIRDRLLGVIEGRCLARRNGAVWQVQTVRSVAARRRLGRTPALREMLLRYSAQLHTNEPVHTWPIG